MLAGQKRGSALRAAFECANCGNAFVRRLSAVDPSTIRHYCSGDCRRADMINISVRSIVGGICEGCGAGFALPNTPRKPHLVRRFCSQPCRYRSRRHYPTIEAALNARRATHRRREARRRSGGALLEATHTEAEWQDLLKRCKGRCSACHKRRKLERDHITPLSRGGSDHIINIQPLCRSCNASKSNRIVQLC
jgi:5-methylcytosine-specific restriction endonuclease McrA